MTSHAKRMWSELRALQTSVRRKHIHWTHVRTHDAAHRQPDTFTKQAFWDHLLQVYKDVYPEQANPSGSIVLFGCVASERHLGSAEERYVTNTSTDQSTLLSSTTGALWQRGPSIITA